MTDGLSSMPPVLEVYDDHAVVCPHCRHRHTDPQEYFSATRDDTEVECEGCGVTFFAERLVSVTYSTAPLRGVP